MCLQTKTTDNETEYKSRRAITKRQRRRHHISWEEFISHLESDIHKIKDSAFNLLKQMTTDIKESANIKSRPIKGTFLYYKVLWTNNILQKNI